MNNTVVAMPQQKNGFLMEPQSLNEAMELANMLANSNLVPKSYQGKPGDVLVACQWGAEIGLKPLQSLQNIAVINNIPAVWGDALVALVRGSGLCEYIKQDWDDASKTATCRVKRKGEPEEMRQFSEEDARVAGHLNKDTYKKNLQRMLSIRARAFALRDVFADVLKGLKVAEEVEDYPAEREVNPSPAQEQKPVNKTAAVLDRVRKGKTGNQPEEHPVTIDQPTTEQPDGQPDGQTDDLVAAEFDKHASAIENADSIQAWQAAYGDAWNWASSTGNENIKKSIKQLAGEAKQKFTTAKQ